VAIIGANIENAIIKKIISIIGLLQLRRLNVLAVYCKLMCKVVGKVQINLIKSAPQSKGGAQKFLAFCYIEFLVKPLAS